ncbi:hypothetical protein [Scatolibacter rhodanostii]|uniref:hypothetical protein n=1 Tax=Scatolibacter rhodanostii TaxID=2014781 RepID=UPI000C0837A2|nr:hypothetical protein [Scatolibacter rhodanostii]
MEVKKQMGKLTELLKKDKLRGAIIVMGLLGIVLIYLSTLLSSDKKVDKEKKTDTEVVFTAEEYEQKLEAKLLRIVSAITGEENPTVMITLETMGEAVYAVDEKHKLDETEQYDGGQRTQTESKEEKESVYVITKDAQGNQQAIKVSEIQPKIKGVVIVSKYANDVFMQEKIIGAAKTAMNVSSSKICVVNAK